MGRRVPLSRSSARVEWLGLGRPPLGGKAAAAWRPFLGAWRWGRWLIAVLAAPFVFISYWLAFLVVVGTICVVLVCIGRPRAALEAIKKVPSAPLVPLNLRGLLMPPIGLSVLSAPWPAGGELRHVGVGWGRSDGSSTERR